MYRTYSSRLRLSKPVVVTAGIEARKDIGCGSHSSQNTTAHEPGLKRRAQLLAGSCLNAVLEPTKGGKVLHDSLDSAVWVEVEGLTDRALAQEASQETRSQETAAV